MSSVVGQSSKVGSGSEIGGRGGHVGYTRVRILYPHVRRGDAIEPIDAPARDLKPRSVLSSSAMTIRRKNGMVIQITTQPAHRNIER